MSDEETAPEMLSRLGTNGMLWAQEFNKTAVRLGYSEMDEGWLVGWFANAIENCDVIRCNPLRAENEKLREALNWFLNGAVPLGGLTRYEYEFVVEARKRAAALKETGE